MVDIDNWSTADVDVCNMDIAVVVPVADTNSVKKHHAAHMVEERGSEHLSRHIKCNRNMSLLKKMNNETTWSWDYDRDLQYAAV